MGSGTQVQNTTHVLQIEDERRQRRRRARRRLESYAESLDDVAEFESELEGLPDTSGACWRSVKDHGADSTGCDDDDLSVSDGIEFMMTCRELCNNDDACGAIVFDYTESKCHLKAASVVFRLLTPP